MRKNIHVSLFAFTLSLIVRYFYKWFFTNESCKLNGKHISCTLIVLWFANNTFPCLLLCLPVRIWRVTASKSIFNFWFPNTDIVLFRDVWEMSRLRCRKHFGGANNKLVIVREKRWKLVLAFVISGLFFLLRWKKDILWNYNWTDRHK